MNTAATITSPPPSGLFYARKREGNSMKPLTYAEFCAGYGGLGLAVEEAFGAELAWYSEFEAAPSAIMAHHWPDVPNHGDMTTIDFTAVQQVDILSGGTPCQDLSHAGRRAGMRTGTRSGLWESMRESIATIKPTYVVWENVRGAYSAGADSELEFCPGCMGTRGDAGKHSLRALGRVLGDLADLGYDTQWRGLRAADVGAPHGRYRVFVLARRRDAANTDLQRCEECFEPSIAAEPEQPTAGGHHGLLPDPAGDSRRIVDGDSQFTADTRSEIGERRAGLRESGPQRIWRGRLDNRDAQVASQPEGFGRVQGRAEHARIERGPDAAERGASVAPDAERERQGDRGRLSLGGLPANTDAGTRDSEEPETTEYADSRGCRQGGQPGMGRPVGSRRNGANDAATPTNPSTGDQDRTNWGSYAPAIARWEAVRGTAPAPTELTAKGKQRLSARFAEWMMGVQVGWITGVPGISRNEQLKAAGNGVVPQQAAAALRDMLKAFQVAP